MILVWYTDYRTGYILTAKRVRKLPVIGQSILINKGFPSYEVVAVGYIGSGVADVYLRQQDFPR